MKNALILLLLVTPLCAQTKKHVQTESEKCWKSVQAISLLDLDTESQNFDSLSSLVSRLDVCSQTLKEDKFKSSVAANLENLILTLRDKKNLQDLSNAYLSQYRSSLAQIADAQKKQQDTEAMLKAAISAYVDLSNDYQKHLASDIALSVRNTQPAPALQPQRGYWANVLQGMSDGAAASVSRPTIHCETNTTGVNAVTDCR